MKINYFLLVFLNVLCISIVAQKDPKDQNAKISSSAKYGNEKLTKSADPSRAAINRYKDSLITVINALKEDTNKVNELGKLYRYMERRYTTAEKLPYVQQARRLMDSLVFVEKSRNLYPFKKKQANCFNMMGSLFLQATNFDSAENNLFKALAIRESIHDQQGIGISYLNLGVLNQTRSNYVKATEYLLKSLNIQEALKDSTSLGFVYYNLSHVNMVTKNFKNAFVYGEKCLAIRKKIHDLIGYSQCATLMGSIYRKTGDTKKAIAFYNTALRIGDSLSLYMDVGNVYNNMAVLYGDQKKYDSAIVMYMNALSVFKKAGHGLFSARTLNNIGRNYLYAHDIKTAKQILNAVTDSLIFYKQFDVLENNYRALAQCDSALGNYKEAFHYAKLYQQTAFENMNLEKVKKLNDLQLTYETSKKEAENQLLSQVNKTQSLELRRNTWLLVGLTGLLVLFLIAGVLIIRQNKLRAEERSRQLEQKLLRSQMNPHFIFNSLQAIQKYILGHEEKAAIKYLNSFAALMREVLENSRTELIPISKEITLLKNYLLLQKLRFDDRFDYQIHIADELGTIHVKLPPMLSQPFIENAIEHGMNDIESGGRIDVYFLLKEDYLLMEIVDNGKGFENDKKTNKQHTSLATEITRERIALMNKKNKNISRFTLTEAFPEAIDRKGVKVSFYIPLNLMNN